MRHQGLDIFREERHPPPRKMLKGNVGIMSTKDTLSKITWPFLHLLAEDHIPGEACSQFLSLLAVSQPQRSSLFYTCLLWQSWCSFHLWWASEEKDWTAHSFPLDTSTGLTVHCQQLCNGEPHASQDPLTLDLAYRSSCKHTWMLSQTKMQRLSNLSSESCHHILANIALSWCV